MKNYLTNLLIEKGIIKDIEEDMNVEGHINLTYEMQMDFICGMPKKIQDQIKTNFVKIDFHNGDVMHFWKHLTEGMLKATGY